MRLTGTLLFIFLSSFIISTSAQSKPAAQGSSQGRKISAAQQTAYKFAAVDKRALQIPDSSTVTAQGIAVYINNNFSRNIDKARAAFIWITSNIQYDLANMYALNFYENKEDKINKPLKTRKGICENYAALFTDICTRSGLRSYVVEGYTKQNGFADYIPHAWSAAFIDTAWFLFDPTWGSGYVNNGKFYNKINNDYFQVNPVVLIHSHMPFDYLWQFLYYPITNPEFYEGKTGQNKTKSFFNYPDSIAVFEKQTELEYCEAAAGRIEKNGVKNALIFERLQYLNREIQYENAKIEMDKQNQAVALYNSSLVDYNEGVNDFNEFINYRNKQFMPLRPDAEIQAMLDSTAGSIKTANSKIDQIHTSDSIKINLINSFRRQIAGFSDKLEEQQDWLNKYFSKSKSGRKSMFTKTTLFGIPLN